MLDIVVYQSKATAVVETTFFKAICINLLPLYVCVETAFIINVFDFGNELQKSLLPMTNLNERLHEKLNAEKGKNIASASVKRKHLKLEYEARLPPL
jgi:hypothetical protein